MSSLFQPKQSSDDVCNRVCGIRIFVGATIITNYVGGSPSVIYFSLSINFTNKNIVLPRIVDHLFSYVKRPSFVYGLCDVSCALLFMIKLSYEREHNDFGQALNWMHAKKGKHLKRSLTSIAMAWIMESTLLAIRIPIAVEIVQRVRLLCW